MQVATYTLSATGVQALSANVTAFHVTISTPPLNPGSGAANPLDYYGIGFLRPGDASAFWDPFAISGGPQWLPCPFGATRVGYSLLNGAVVSLVEVFGPSPLAVPLAQLPDVALSSPADTQVLTYQASSSKWINAAAPTGGGGGGSGIGHLLLDAAPSGDLSGTFVISPGSWTDWPSTHWPAQSFTVTAASVPLLIVLGGQAWFDIPSNNVQSSGIRVQIDGATNLQIGGAYAPNDGRANPFTGTRLISGLTAASHTIKIQMYGGNSQTYNLRYTPSTRPEQFMRLQVLQLA